MGKIQTESPCTRSSPERPYRDNSGRAFPARREYADAMGGEASLRRASAAQRVPMLGSIALPYNQQGRNVDGSLSVVQETSSYAASMLAKPSFGWAAGVKVGGGRRRLACGNPVQARGGESAEMKRLPPSRELGDILTRRALFRATSASATSPGSGARRSMKAR
jgi:hypothetical protein